MKKMVLLLLLVSALGLNAYGSYGPGDIVGSFALPYGFHAQSDCTGLAQLKGKLWCIQNAACEIWLGNANTGVWEKSWSLSGLDQHPYDLGLSASGDTLIMVGNANACLYFLDTKDPTSVLYTMQLSGYLTGCTYLLDFRGNYRVLVIDCENYKFYEVDPIAMEYKKDWDPPSQLCKPYWLRGLDYDTKSDAMTLCVTCFNEGGTQLDSSMIVELNHNDNFTYRTDLDGSWGTWGGGPGYFYPTVAYDSTGKGNYSDGIRTYNNIRSAAYNHNFPYQSRSADVFQGAGMGFVNDPGYAPACVYCYGGFIPRDKLKQTTWGGIKKVYSNMDSSNRSRLDKEVVGKGNPKPVSFKLSRVHLPRMSVR